jgi:hypothetical protein
MSGNGCVCLVKTCVYVRLPFDVYYKSGVLAGECRLIFSDEMANTRTREKCPRYKARKRKKKINYKSDW